MSKKSNPAVNNPVIGAPYTDTSSIYSPTAVIEFVGQIQLVTNHSTTFPSDDGSVNQKNKFKMRKEERQQWNGLAARGHTVINGKDGKKESSFIPGTSIKSLGRRSGSIIQMEFAKKSGTVLEMRLANALYNGHNNIKDESVYLPENIIKEQEACPFVYAYGSWKMASVFEVQDAIPQKPITVIMDKRSQTPLPASVLNDQLDEKAREDFVARRQEVADNSKVIKEKSKLEQKIVKARKADMFDSKGALKEDLDEDGEIADAIARLEEINQQLEDEKNGGGERANADRMLYTEHYTPAGTVFNHRMRINDVRNSVASSIFTTSYARVARAPRLGAHQAKGYGYFIASYDVILHDLNKKSVKLGTFYMGHTGRVKTQEEAITQDQVEAPTPEQVFIPEGEAGKAWWADCQGNRSWLGKFGS